MAPPCLVGHLPVDSGLEALVVGLAVRSMPPARTVVGLKSGLPALPAVSSTTEVVGGAWGPGCHRLALKPPQSREGVRGGGARSALRGLRAARLRAARAATGRVVPTASLSGARSTATGDWPSSAARAATSHGAARGGPRGPTPARQNLRLLESAR